jgi:hypothetical protein
MSRIISSRFAACAASLVLAAASHAQNIHQQPLGFVLDAGISRVRPLLGVPGAAIVGDPVDLGADISASAASLKQDYLVVLSGPSRTAGIWTNGAQAIEPLAGVRLGATQVVLSPEGTSAAFYYADTKQVHVMTGLPLAPVPTFEANLSSMMNPLQSLAVSDDGALLLASESHIDGNAAPAVVVFGAQGVASRIATVGAASAIAFLGGSHDALISAVSEAVLIRDAATQASRVLLPTAANSASAVTASSDGSRAYFARSQAGTVSILSLKSAGSPATVVNCNCTPTGLARTTSASVYRLTDNSGEPVYLLDDASLNSASLSASSAQPRLLIIPPVVKSLASSVSTHPDNQ